MIPLLFAGAMELAKAFLPSMVGKIAGDASGKIAEKVLDIAADVTGISMNDPAGPGAALEAINRDPALAAQFQTSMAELELATTEAYLEDRQNARGRDIEYIKAGKQNVRADVMVVAAFMAIVVIAVFLIMKDNIDTGVMAFLTTIGGMLMKNISTAFDFEFGSSRGSKNKTNEMGEMMKLLKK